MKKFWAFFDKLERWMRGAGAFCLASMMVLTCADIIGRVFDHPIFGSEEIVSFLFTLTIGLALPYSHKEKIHVGVEILFRLCSAPVRVILTLITTTASLILMAIITIMMFDYFLTTRASGEVSMNLELPEYYVILGLAICFFIMSVFILRDILILSRIKESILRFEKDIGAS